MKTSIKRFSIYHFSVNSVISGKHIITAEIYAQESNDLKLAG
jgi:hypothetical protein